MPPKRHGSTAASSTSVEPAASIEPTALTIAITDALKSRALIDVLVPILTEAFADIVCRDINKAIELELQSRDARIGKLENEVRNLTEKMDVHDQYSRRNCLIVHGLKESSQPENTDKRVIEAANHHLGLTITPESIDRSHRIGSRLDKFGNPRVRPLIVKFVDYNTRANFYRLRSKFKGSNIFVQESLTRERQGWLHTAKNHPQTEKIWTQDGRVEIRQKDGNRFVIGCRDDLKKLK